MRTNERPSSGRGDDGSPYRRPGDLSHLVAPDRRRLKAALLIGAGLLAGAIGVAVVKRAAGPKNPGAADEARTTLREMARQAVKGYERERLNAAVISEGETTRVVHVVCPSASHAVPADRTMVSGRSYQATSAEWTVDAYTDAGFACFRWAPTERQRYQYDYNATATGFVVRAEGDVDGDGVYSTFELRGRIDRDHRLLVDEKITETNPDE